MTEVIFWILVILLGAAIAIGCRTRPIQPRKNDDDDDDDDVLEINIHVKMDSADNAKHSEGTYEYWGMDSTDNPRYSGRTYKYLEIGSADNAKHTERTYEYQDNHNIHLKL